ncbi:MAG: MFS transporter [Peptococcaceae bacterium]
MRGSRELKLDEVHKADQEALIKKYALIIVMVASFLTPFMGSAINLAIPAIGKTFNSTALQLSWVVSSYLMTSAAFLLPLGRLADIIGRKKIFTAGIIIFPLFSMLCGLAWSVKTLIFFRILQGIGGAMIFGTSMAILTSVFPPQERGKVLGINVATVYTGLSLGPVLGGVINHYLGWPFIFYFNALLSALIVPLIFTKLKGEWFGARGESFDLSGAFLYALGIIAFLYGLSTIATLEWGRFIFLLGLVILVIFIKQEAKIKQPILNIKLFRKNITFIFSNLAALINYSATFAVGFLLSVYLQVVGKYNSQTAGLILLSQPVLMALLSPFAGALSDHVEPRVVASLGMGLTTAGLFLFYFLTGSTPLWLVIVNLALLGIGFALFSSPNSNAVMGAVEKRFYGVASSTLGTMRLVGQAISMAIATLVIDLYLGNVQLGLARSDLILKSIKISFIIFALTCLGGIFASLARGKVARKTN